MIFIVNQVSDGVGIPCVVPPGPAAFGLLQPTPFASIHCKYRELPHPKRTTVIVCEFDVDLNSMNDS